MLNRIFSRLPLNAKLVLIGLVPFIFLVYISVRLLQKNQQKQQLFEGYIDRMHQAADINNLIDYLRMERRYSFQYVITKELPGELKEYRPKTDSILNRLTKYEKNLADFRAYTFLKDLHSVRQAVDSGALSVTLVMDYYTNALFRFNMLNQLPAGSDVYLQPIHKDLVTQKILSEMVTYLGILSANIYNALYTKQYMIEILMGSGGVYQFYKSFEVELLMKGSPGAISSYRQMKDSGSLKQVDAYLDRLFSSFSFDSSFNHSSWSESSFGAIDQLRALQQEVLQKGLDHLNEIYQDEKISNRNTIILLIVLLIIVVTLVIGVIWNISKALNDLKRSAQKISRGEESPPFHIQSRDAIGSLARSVYKIQENERAIALAAQEIGNGNFDAAVKIRGANDLLGNAIVKMRDNLQQLISDLKTAKEEIAGLNTDLERKVELRTTELQAANRELESFSYSVSHDLRAPLRSVIGFAVILEDDHGAQLSEEAKRVVGIIKDNTLKMGRLIDDLLNFSRTGRQEIKSSLFPTTPIVKEVIEELGAKHQNIHWNIQELPQTRGDLNTLKQVWINLISNAVKYSGKRTDPRIEIGSYSQDGEIVFFVKDNGVGFDEKYSDKLFKVFQRLHHEKDFEGTGIGLALVEKIVSKHGGRVWAESKPGEGASFYFSLPAEPNHSDI